MALLLVFRAERSIYRFLSVLENSERRTDFTLRSVALGEVDTSFRGEGRGETRGEEIVGDGMGRGDELGEEW